MRPSSLLLLLAATVLACHTPAPRPERSEAEPVSLGPPSPGARIEAERWARAVEGLRFDAPGGLVAVEPVVSERSAAEHLARGDGLLGENRVIDALEQYALAARVDPGLTDAYVGIGIITNREGRLDEALASFRTALDRDPAHTEARYRLAMTLWSGGELEAATAEMQQVLVIDAEHGRAHERLAVWSYYAGDREAALRHLERAESLGRRVPGQLADLLQRLGPDATGTR